MNKLRLRAGDTDDARRERRQQGAQWQLQLDRMLRDPHGSDEVKEAECGENSRWQWERQRDQQRDQQRRRAFGWRPITSDTVVRDNASTNAPPGRLQDAVGGTRPDGASAEDDAAGDGEGSKRHPADAEAETTSHAPIDSEALDDVDPVQLLLDSLFSDQDDCDADEKQAASSAAREGASVALRAALEANTSAWAASVALSTARTEAINRLLQVAGSHAQMGHLLLSATYAHVATVLTGARLRSRL